MAQETGTRQRYAEQARDQKQDLRQGRGRGPVAHRTNVEAQVGLFATVALIMFIYGWSWLKGLSVLHPPQRFTVQFHDVAGLNSNAPVNVNGVRVGTVEKLSLKKRGRSWSSSKSIPRT